MLSISALLSGFGVFLVLHSAYSALQYRTILLSARDVPDGLNPDRPPADAVLEVLFAFGLCLVGQLSSETFLSVKTTTARGGRTASSVAPAYKSRDFDIYATRAAGVFGATR
mmetsp:Transcript_3286/g.7208  ORF Transcript_3286/g.7208 Transcript_3286/m.7208 type:complete len:112 (-) Transcript_3286:244-579(-)